MSTNTVKSFTHLKVILYLSIELAGFSGNLCQVDIDECASTPCKNGAKCTDGPNKYTCECAEGKETIFQFQKV